MRSFEFQVAKNLSGNEGIVSGRFTVTELGKPVADCFEVCEWFLQKNRLQHEKILPLILDEHLGFRFIRQMLPQVSNRIGGYVTFGTDRDTAQRVPIRTHSEIIPADLGRENPDFLAAMLTIPSDGREVTPEIWQHESLLGDCHLRYGHIIVAGSTCVIECT